MAEQNYREKIKKLLALSESSNEHEAKSALLKAKKLMAEYKVSEADLEDIQNKAVVRVTTQFDCSKRREPWMVSLSAIIGQNFCCQAFRNKYPGRQTQTIGFIGLEGDIETCVSIFEYAVSCIRSNIQHIRKEMQDCSWEYRKRVCDGYGFGFASGVREAFEKQKEQDETGWGLVMVIPKEVKDATKDFGHESFDGAAQQRMHRKGFVKGYEDGEKFDPGTKLSGAEKEENLALGGI